MADPAAVLGAWGLDGAPVRLVATRENTVYRVETPTGPAALRLRRPGYRSLAQIRSELDWMAALAAAGLRVPAPIPARDGALCVARGGLAADLIQWVEGAPMGVDGVLAEAPDLPARYHALGVTAARMHQICDAWDGAPRVVRPAWDADGLLGAAPVWGRFWEIPTLTPAQRALVDAARARAAAHLARIGETLDYGLIHADLTPENVIVAGAAVSVIDFDDGGWGFRVFELATIANRALRHAQGAVLIAALLDGYRSVRPADTHALPLFQLLRAFTYLGWIVPRLHEPGAVARSERFTAVAIQLAGRYLDDEGGPHDR